MLSGPGASATVNTRTDGGGGVARLLPFVFPTLLQPHLAPALSPPHPVHAGGAPHLRDSEAEQGLTWKEKNLALMFCSLRCSRACRKRMPRAQSPKRVEAPARVLIQRATLSAEICRGHTGNTPGLTMLLCKARATPCPSPCPGSHISRVVVPISRQDQPQEDSKRPK